MYLLFKIRRLSSVVLVFWRVRRCTNNDHGWSTYLPPSRPCERSLVSNSIFKRSFGSTVSGAALTSSSDWICIGDRPMVFCHWGTVAGTCASSSNKQNEDQSVAVVLRNLLTHEFHHEIIGLPKNTSSAGSMGLKLLLARQPEGIMGEKKYCKSMSSGKVQQGPVIDCAWCYVVFLSANRSCDPYLPGLF